jgi:hypothetical protein
MSNWTVKSYVNDAFTDLVRVPATVKSLIVANTSGSAASATIRLTLGGTELAQVLPAFELAAGEAKILDLHDLDIMQGQELQVTGTAAGLHFIASGTETAL